MKPPLVGVVTSFSRGVHRLRRDYVEAVERAGGVPLLLPASSRASTVSHLLESLDALVVSGGPAIVDGLVGDLPSDLAETDLVRLGSDKSITAAFVDSRKPVLGICYGMQLLNALDGGTIYGDVQRQVEGSLCHSEKRGGRDHPITVVTGSILSELFGRRELVVTSRHIQAVADVGPSYRVSGIAPDGVIEAIEGDEGRLVGVQFHPELMGASMLPLFQHLVVRARRGRPTSSRIKK